MIILKSFLIEIFVGMKFPKLEIGDVCKTKFPVCYLQRNTYYFYTYQSQTIDYQINIWF